MLGVAVKLPAGEGLADCLFPLATVRDSCSVARLEKAVRTIATGMIPFSVNASAKPQTGAVTLELGRTGIDVILGKLSGSMPYVTKSVAPVVTLTVPPGGAIRVQKSHAFRVHGLTVTDSGRPVSFWPMLGRKDAPVAAPAVAEVPSDRATFLVKFLADTQAKAKDDTGEERFVMGIVLEPDVVDGQGDTYDAETVRNAAHFFMEEHQNIDLQHSFVEFDGVRVLESFIAPAEFTIGDVTVKAGTWVMAVRVLDDVVWAAVKAGEFTGFSIGGRAVPKPIASTEKRRQAVA